MPVDRERTRFVFQKLNRQLDKLANKPQPNDVHQFRTYSRRLQALLEELPPKLSRNDKKLLKLLRRLRRRAGRVRDLDVQIAALHSLKIPQEPRRKAQLLDALTEMRGKRERKLHDSLDKVTTRELGKRLKKAAKNYEIAETTEPLRVARQRLTDVSKPQLPLTEDVLHQYRIAGKRARYVAELAGKAPEAEPFIRSLVSMQDALGDWHDWWLLSQSAEKIIHDAPDSALLSALHNVTGAKFRHAVRVVTEMRKGLFGTATSIDGAKRAQSGVAASSRKPSTSHTEPVRATA